MADGPSAKAEDPGKVLPPEAAKEVLEKKLEQVPPQELVAQFFAAFSRTTIGPGNSQNLSRGGNAR